VRTRDGASVQLVAPPADLPSALSTAAAWAAAHWPTDCHRSALRVRELPSHVLLSSAGSAAWAASTPTAGSQGRRTWLGVGGDEASPASLDLAADPVVVVAGPPGSGRSTTLEAIAYGVFASGGRVIVVCPRPSPLDAGPWAVLGPLDHDALREQMAPGACVLVDDAELLADGQLDAVLQNLIRERGPTAVVLAATTSALLGTFRGALAAARSSRTGVLLQPSGASEGDVFGVRAQLGDRNGPGRGLLVVRGVQSALQVGQWSDGPSTGRPDGRSPTAGGGALVSAHA
jgi:S-DNA-T family DNA segregation ATPase FtsK/SpoIIIE